ncbi:hypothetical protein [Longimicrobium sp.]|jgi:hypothetical protein|uniref:hypothetical protein n=1 Tax=Longimicrobium sp. TaxID=2029185 RepID=UPI002EDA2549
MTDEAEFEMADAYEFRGARPSRLYVPMTRDEYDDAVRKAACGYSKAWDRIAGESIRAAEQAIIVHWALVRHDGRDPRNEVWTDAPEYGEIVEDRAWLCSDTYLTKEVLAPAEMKRMREIEARANALAERLDGIVAAHLGAKGFSPHQVAQLREAALYGPRTAATA